ncbi:MAG: curlin repeat-containing protein [Runella sp.]
MPGDPFLQAGSNNTVTITQTGNGGIVTGGQAGSGNTVTITQNN